METISSAKWLSDMGMEEESAALDYQYQMSPLDYSIDELDFQSFSSTNDQFFHPQATENYISNSYLSSMERPAKQLKANSWNSSAISNKIVATPKASPSSSSRIISFENSNSPSPNCQFYSVDVKPKRKVEYSEGNTDQYTTSNLFSQGSIEDKHGSPFYGQAAPKRTGPMSKTSVNAQDHVIAERKRREKLSQRFIELSAVIPGLKKMDKASVLGDAIKHLKQLQERVKLLEEQAAKKTVESVVLVKKSQVYAEDDSSSSDENFDGSSAGSCEQQLLPQVEARVSDRDVLVKIHCEKEKGSLVRILTEMENLHLTVVNANVLPFGEATLDITLGAQMDMDFSMTGKDLVRSLRRALLNFM